MAAEGMSVAAVGEGVSSSVWRLVGYGAGSIACPFGTTAVVAVVATNRRTTAVAEVG